MQLVVVLLIMSLYEEIKYVRNSCNNTNFSSCFSVFYELIVL